MLDLPLAAVPAAASILKYSDLNIIVSDYRLARVIEIQSTVNIFRYLGIRPEDTAALLVDPEGGVPDLTLGHIKPYIEANLGITLAEIISFDAKMSQLFYLDSQPVVQSNPNLKFSQEIMRIAGFISGFGYADKPIPQAAKIYLHWRKY